VKYKRDTGSGHNDDVYQLLAYATALGLKETTLVYADRPQTLMRHDIRGADIAIHRHRLDLSASPPALLGQIAKLTDHIRQRAEW